MKIPENAKRVFKGEIFDVYQWPQKMFDGSDATFEMAKRPNTVVVIALVGDKIILMNELQPQYAQVAPSLPGGRVEENEEPLVGAQRELLEETGYQSDDWQLWKQFEPEAKVDWVIYFYIARDCKLTTEPHLDAGEKITTELISFEEFLNLTEDPTFRELGLVSELLRMKLDSKKLTEFKKLLFK